MQPVEVQADGSLMPLGEIVSPEGDAGGDGDATAEDGGADATEEQ
jgi:hypothetical protein